MRGEGGRGLGFISLCTVSSCGLKDERSQDTFIDIHRDVQGPRAGSRSTLQGGTRAYESLEKSPFDQEFKLIKEDQEKVRSFMILAAR